MGREKASGLSEFGQKGVRHGTAVRQNRQHHIAAVDGHGGVVLPQSGLIGVQGIVGHLVHTGLEHIPQLLRIVTSLIIDVLQLRAMGVLHGDIKEENFLVELDYDKTVKQVVVANLGEREHRHEPDDESGTYILPVECVPDNLSEFMKGDDLYSLGCIVSGFLDKRPYFESIDEVTHRFFSYNPFPFITNADQGVRSFKQIENNNQVIGRYTQYIKDYNEKRRHGFNTTIEAFTNPTVRAFLGICLDFVNGTMCKDEQRIDWTDVERFVGRFNEFARQIGQEPVPFKSSR